MTTGLDVDLEAELIAAVAAQFPDARVSVETPPLATMQATPKVIRLRRGGGTVTDKVIDKATVEFDCYGSDYVVASQLARDLWRWLILTLPGMALTTTVVRGVDPISAPQWVPWVDNTDRRRFHASCLITHRP